MIKSKKGYRCPVCLLSVCNHIADLEVSVLGLYNDSRFPGRCILVLREHAENFSALNQELTRAFVADAQLAARAIARAVAAKRLNYAILGNAQPHLHFHLIPRLGLVDDPIPDKAPWAHPLPVSELLPQEIERLVAAIREEVATELRTNRSAERKSGVSMAV